MTLKPLRARDAIITLLALVACVPILARTSLNSPRTRAEATGFRETSRYSDVVAFIDSLRDRPLTFGSIGRTNEGREIPYIIASYPQVSTPEEARALKRPIVYVQANIHAGEVEGKEALLALVRDLSAAPRPGVLDSIVLIAVPIYNADGNERFASQSVNRSAQDGPELVGVRQNAQGLDLNRDYIKAEAPETRASLAMFNAWDPDVFVDLHTTDGSYHRYALTYAPPLHPSAPLGAYTRDSLLPILQSRMKARHSFETFDYGDFISEDTLSKGWATFDSRPRFGTNYYGLRGRISFLSEAFSHDPFEKRIASTYAFTREILSLVAERAVSILARNSAATQMGVSVAGRPPVALQSQMAAAPKLRPIAAEFLEKTGDTLRSAPGVRRGYRRSGRFQTVSMPVFDRFEPTLLQEAPSGYLISPSDTALVRMLQLHGITVESNFKVRRGRLLTFVLDSARREPRVFQRHNERRIFGRWVQKAFSEMNIPAGLFYVSTHQPRGLLVQYLLEPMSDDGFATWNFFDSQLKPGAVFSVSRVELIYNGIN
ncbi:MAG: M14 family metallopeptidase [Gemmatimonadaceae bacterium]|nr:M14 family metallopeptidase [Gemmatimonadaceae bacterium]